MTAPEAGLPQRHGVSAGDELAGRPQGRLDEKREVTEVERAVGRGYLWGGMRPLHRAFRRTLPLIDRHVERQRQPRQTADAFVARLHRPVDDGHDGDVDRVVVVSRGRLRWGRFRFVVAVVVVMAAGAVMVVTVVVMTDRCRVRVDVRTEAVSGGLAPAVGVAEDG